MPPTTNHPSYLLPSLPHPASPALNPHPPASSTSIPAFVTALQAVTIVLEGVSVLWLMPFIYIPTVALRYFNILRLLRLLTVLTKIKKVAFVFSSLKSILKGSVAVINLVCPHHTTHIFPPACPRRRSPRRHYPSTP